MPTFFSLWPYLHAVVNSGNWLIQTLMGHTIVSELIECPSLAGSQKNKKHPRHMFYRYEDESRYFHEKTLLNFSTVTVTNLS